MSGLQHPDSRSFECVAELYERRRPGYPRAAMQWLSDRLDIRAGRVVLDLGAGTGKLTRELVATGAHVVAVEPGEQMLGQLRRVVPQAESLLGAAEAIPVADSTVDVVTVGQAFHWFRADEAFAEIRRVLRPGGGLGLIWNERDQSDALQQRVTSLINRFVPSGRPPRSSSWAESLIRDAQFGSMNKAEFPHAEALQAEELVERIGTTSFVVAAPREQRAELDAQLHGLAAEHGGAVEFRYVTRAYVAFSEA
jgi:ubiquinone/menaquinone biosynthesis C-methylase UbiE